MTLSFKGMFQWDDIHSRPLFIPNSAEVVWESFEKERKTSRNKSNTSNISRNVFIALIKLKLLHLCIFLKWVIASNSWSGK